MLCLVFLFFETAFGICIGCNIYGLFNKGKAQYCPGEICDVKSKHDIQKTSKAQMAVVIGLVVFVFLMVLLFNENLSENPKELFEMLDGV